MAVDWNIRHANVNVLNTAIEHQNLIDWVVSKYSVLLKYDYLNHATQKL